MTPDTLIKDLEKEQKLQSYKLFRSLRLTLSENR